MAITAIETRYAGCRFRSRLEARWAVLFDNLNIRWEYEPQGYYIERWQGQRAETPYLPDFRLPELNLWVEVKGSNEGLNKQLLVDALDWGGGLPGVRYSDETGGGLVILGPILRPDVTAIPSHTLLTHYKGVVHRTMTFTWSGNYRKLTGPGCLMDACGDPCGCDWLQSYREAHDDYVSDAYRAARSARFEHGERG